MSPSLVWIRRERRWYEKVCEHFKSASLSALRLIPRLLVLLLAYPSVGGFVISTCLPFSWSSAHFLRSDIPRLDLFLLPFGTNKWRCYPRVLVTPSFFCNPISHAPSPPHRPTKFVFFFWVSLRVKESSHFQTNFARKRPWVYGRRGGVGNGHSQQGGSG